MSIITTEAPPLSHSCFSLLVGTNHGHFRVASRQTSKHNHPCPRPSARKPFPQQADRPGRLEATAELATCMGGGSVHTVGAEETNRMEELSSVSRTCHSWPKTFASAMTVYRGAIMSPNRKSPMGSLSAKCPGLLDQDRNKVLVGLEFDPLATTQMGSKTCCLSVGCVCENANPELGRHIALPPFR
jgi:hypothetical protein